MRVGAARTLVLLAHGHTSGSVVSDPWPTRKTDLQSNSRLGLTFSLPVGRRSSLRVAWATGFTTSIGGDFDTLTLAWPTLWFSRSDEP